MVWGHCLTLLQVPVFIGEKEDLFNVIDNRTQELQRQNLHSESHNVLYKTDLVKIKHTKSFSAVKTGIVQPKTLFTVGV